MVVVETSGCGVEKLTLTLMVAIDLKYVEVSSCCTPFSVPYIQSYICILPASSRRPPPSALGSLTRYLGSCLEPSKCSGYIHPLSILIEIERMGDLLAAVDASMSK